MRRRRPVPATGDEFALELEHGDGHYDERQERLGTTRKLLRGKPRVDMVKVLEALEAAKVGALHYQLEGVGLENQDRLTTEVHYIQTALPRIRALLEFETQAHLETTGEVLNTVGPALRALEIVEAYVQQRYDTSSDGRLFFNVLTGDGRPGKVAADTHRPRAGNQPKPHIHAARQALRNAGIKDKHTQDELLIAVGVIPSR